MPTTLPLSKLVDLALGTPEVGAVNFNVLHTLLHAMISKLNIRDVKADINESDRDFLSSTKHQRVMTALSDIDSGKGEDSEDALSEIRDSSELDSPASSAKHKAKRSVPYHHLELRVEKLAEQLENLNALPTNSDLFERAKAKGDGERPIADMWQYMQLKKRVDANEEGVGKLMSLVEDLMKEMQTLRDTNSNLLDRINGLNIDELNKKLADLEKVTNDLNDKFSTLPTADDYAQFVTWPLLEDALKGVRKDLEQLQIPVQERVVIETGSQTENRMPSRPSSSHHTSSRPTSSRPLSRLSTASSGPTNDLLDILERIGKLSECHDALTKRVEELEEQLKNKLDKDALEGLMQQLANLSEKQENQEPLVVTLPAQIERSEVISTLSQTSPEPIPDSPKLVTIVETPEPVKSPSPPPVIESEVEIVFSSSEPETEPVTVFPVQVECVQEPEPVKSEPKPVEVTSIKPVSPPPAQPEPVIIHMPGPDISGDLMEQLNKLKEELDALQSMRDKLPTTISTSGSVGNKHMSTDGAGKIHTSQPPSDGESSDTGTISASEGPLLSHNQSSQELLAILRSRVSDSEAFEELISRVGNLEENFKNLQQAILNPVAIVGSQQLPTTISTSGSVGNKHMSTDGAGKIHTSQAPSDGKSSDTGTISASEGPSLSHNQSSQEMLAILQSRVSDSEAFEELISRLRNLEDNFKNLQQAILNPMAIEDSGFSSEPFGDLQSCFSDMDEKIVMLSPVSSNVTDPASEGESKGQKGSLKKGHDIGEIPEEGKVDHHLSSLSDVTDPASEGESKGQKKGSLKKGHDIGEIPEEGKVDHHLSSLSDSTQDESDAYNLNLGSELNSTNEKLKHLRRALDDQMGEVRNKIFALDHDLKRMAKGVEFALMQSRVKGSSNMDADALKAQKAELERLNNIIQNIVEENKHRAEQIESLLTMRHSVEEIIKNLQSRHPDDTDALSRAQKAILQLQAELERLNNITQEIVEENKHRSKQIENLLAYCDTLQDKKADKEYVAMEVDVKADKRQLDNKVNHSLFDNTTGEINKIIKEILDKLNGNESSWKDAIAQLADEVEGKLDRLELDPLKEWLESRLKALNKKIMANAGNEWSDDDAAGLRKQLLQRFNCLSCDRPVDLMPTGPVPSLPSQNGLPPTRSPRPYTTYELDQIRQNAKSGYRGTNMVNFERALADKSLAKMRRTDLKAFLVHFGRDIEAMTHSQRREHGIFNQQDVADYYATTRQCGGNHTLTYPHKRVSRMTQMNNLFKEDGDPAPAQVYPIYKEEVDVQGVDGHIYRGRVERMQIEAKMPSKISPQPSNQVAPISPATPRTLRKIPGLETDPVRGSPTPPTGMRGRPMSARGSASPRPASGRLPSRPQSTHPMSAGQSGLESSRTTPFQEDPMLQDGGPTDQGQITVESEAIRVDVPTPDMIEEQTEG